MEHPKSRERCSRERVKREERRGTEAAPAGLHYAAMKTPAGAPPVELIGRPAR